MFRGGFASRPPTHRGYTSINSFYRGGKDKFPLKRGLISLLWGVGKQSIRGCSPFGWVGMGR